MNEPNQEPNSWSIINKYEGKHFVMPVILCCFVDILICQHTITSKR